MRRLRQRLALWLAPWLAEDEPSNMTAWFDLDALLPSGGRVTGGAVVYNTSDGFDLSGGAPGIIVMPTESAEPIDVSDLPTGL